MAGLRAQQQLPRIFGGNMTQLTDQQVDHANFIAEQFVERMQRKYEKGALEHGGNLWDMEPELLLDNAIDEAIDQVVYLITLQAHLKELAEKAWMYDDLTK